MKDWIVLGAACSIAIVNNMANAQEKVTRCHHEGNQLVCEEHEIRPTEYIGKKKWCTFMPNNIITGSLAVCAYDKKSS